MESLSLIQSSRRSWSLEESRSFLETLAQSVYGHEALHNAFFDIWTKRKLPIADIAVFARNYGHFNRTFPELLARMIAHTDDIETRLEYAKTLYSEMGYGELRKVHSRLFDEFIAALGEQLGDRRRLTWEVLAKELPILPQTQALIEGELVLYTGDPATGAGAQLALEWQAYTMQSLLYEGSRNYRDLWPTVDGFHEACEFFYAHIGAAEKEHKDESLLAAIQMDRDELHRKRLVAGFQQHNLLFANFWNGIAAQFQRAG